MVVGEGKKEAGLNPCLFTAPSDYYCEVWQSVFHTTYISAKIWFCHHHLCPKRESRKPSFYVSNFQDSYYEFVAACMMHVVEFPDEEKLRIPSPSLLLLSAIKQAIHGSFGLENWIVLFFVGKN